MYKKNPKTNVNLFSILGLEKKKKKGEAGEICFPFCFCTLATVANGSNLDTLDSQSGSNRITYLLLPPHIDSFHLRWLMTSALAMKIRNKSGIICKSRSWNSPPLLLLLSLSLFHARTHADKIFTCTLLFRVKNIFL